MNVAYQFGKIASRVANDRFVPVLEYMPVPTMPQIVADCVPGEKNAG
jgi:hypothetical protein